MRKQGGGGGNVLYVGFIDLEKGYDRVNSDHYGKF